MYEQKVKNRKLETEQNVCTESLKQIVWKECVCGMFVKSLRRMCFTESLKQNVRKQEVLYRKFET